MWYSIWPAASLWQSADPINFISPHVNSINVTGQFVSFLVYFTLNFGWQVLGSYDIQYGQQRSVDTICRSHRLHKSPCQFKQCDWPICIVPCVLYFEFWLTSPWVIWYSIWSAASLRQSANSINFISPHVNSVNVTDQFDSFFVCFYFWLTNLWVIWYSIWPAASRIDNLPIPSTSYKCQCQFNQCNWPICIFPCVLSLWILADKSVGHMVLYLASRVPDTQSGDPIDFIGPLVNSINVTSQFVSFHMCSNCKFLQTNPWVIWYSVWPAASRIHNLTIPSTS